MAERTHESPHAHHLRKGRHTCAGQIYLITTVTRDREPLFSDLYRGRAVVQALRDARLSTRSLAFVIMPDHLHWLMQLREGYALSDVVHFVKSDSARLVNRLRKGWGSVWQKGFHDRAIRREELLQVHARYIVNNPVRAGIVDSPHRYSLWDSVWV